MCVDASCCTKGGASSYQSECVAVSAHERTVGGRGMGGLPLLLLSVRAAHRSAAHRVVVYFEHDGKHLVVGTDGRFQGNHSRCGTSAPQASATAFATRSTTSRPCR